MSSVQQKNVVQSALGLQLFPFPWQRFYAGLITQSGASAPTLTDFHNDMGTITPARSAQGVYTLTFAAGIIPNGALIWIMNSKDMTVGHFLFASRVSVTQIQINTRNAAGALTDSLLNNANLLILGY